MVELIVLTCASGKQCSQLIPLLYNESSLYRLRLIVNSKASYKKLSEQFPEAETVQVDLLDVGQCSQILDRASTIYYVSPTFQPHEVQFGLNIIDAAIAEARKPQSRFSHFILSSVLHPEISKLLNHDRKRLIEEYLCESTLKYTILQPSHFADNAIGRLLALRDSTDPVFIAAHDPEVAFSFSCIQDHAEISAKVIRERRNHFYATYQLVSTWPMKYSEYVQSVGAVIGKTIEIKQLQYEETVAMYCKLVFGAQEVDQTLRDGPERLLLYYSKRGIIGNPGVLEWLLGRPGTTPAQLAKAMLEKF
ncbi:hypothetical protein LTR10_018706 [Elasticomyces elasticus]|uniref:NmrA-like domain-containing protein n=1 Tax=Exophiala sideris TaxID=1016849 RepID=A0ABR0JAE9_9EURO|nr:hypothetical protein LTR10_018706 [Elasticomyces elasticus]KAK5026259.1 hypothetical protein LTS07_007784 [Exophiala sideris]KAK5032512.1 hypothetical protein LTR13_007335 [Exophiala sideris]KAK5059671.1 hypothetical protein LTR69_006260 [Exophiala sideris]KAK5178046.1 hypothetical protein LTR44_009352 [Eurotiomycetes sp. CCFEE 6388]